MSAEDLLQTAFNFLLTQVPLIIVAGAGLWFAMTSRQLPIRVATYAKWGFALLIVNSLASVTLAVLSLQLRITMGGEDLVWLNIIRFAAYPLFAIGIGLIARAVFLGR